MFANTYIYASVGEIIVFTYIRMGHYPDVLGIDYVKERAG